MRTTLAVAAAALAALAGLATLCASCGQQPAAQDPQGTLVVRVDGADGKPYRYESTLSVNWFFPDGKGSRMEHKLARGEHEARVTVPLGAKLTLVGFADGTWLEPVQIEPLTKERPSSECRLTIAHEPVKLVARVLALDGKPYEGGKVTARLLREPPARTQRLFPEEPAELPPPTTVALDSSSTATLSLPAKEVAGLSAAWLELGFRDLKGFARVPDALAPGEHALGDVRLREPVAIASGTLVGADGKPVIGGAFHVRTGSPPREIDGSLLLVERQERGRFSIRAWTEAASFELVVDHDEHVSCEPRAVAAGAKDVQIALERAGSFVFEAKPAPDELWLEGARPAPRPRAAERLPDGTVRVTWRGVPPGTWTLRGKSGGAESTLREGLVIKPGEMAR